MKHRSILPADTGSKPSRRVPTDAEGQLRILLLGGDIETAERLEAALWIWPHRISRCNSVEQALDMCRHLYPAAVVVPLKAGSQSPLRQISRLHSSLPRVPVVAIASPATRTQSADLIARGASAVIGTRELHGSRLYDLLTRLRESHCAHNAPDVIPTVRLETPWRQSPIIGALISDIDGHILDANDCLAKWLGYKSGDALRGGHLWHDLLDSRADWTSWKTVAGDVHTVHQDTVFIRGANEQLLWMQAQVFAASSSPTHLQAAFVDQTELAQLSSAMHMQSDDQATPLLARVLEHS